jgi:hypothetical protein
MSNEKMKLLIVLKSIQKQLCSSETDSRENRERIAGMLGEVVDEWQAALAQQASFVSVEQCAEYIKKTNRYSTSEKAIFLVSPECRVEIAKAILSLRNAEPAIAQQASEPVHTWVCGHEDCSSNGELMDSTLCDCHGKFTTKQEQQKESE